MINVECPSCQAPYELDERRMPASGMKMRCPKCGSSFHVARDGQATMGDVSAAPKPKPKATMVGIGVPDGDAPGAELSLGVDDLESVRAPAPPAYKPPPPPPPPPPRPKFAPDFPSADDLDLPAPAAPKSAGFADLADLPAPAKPKAGPMDDLLDLPAPAKPKAGPMDDLLDLPAPAKPKAGPMDDLLDLPAPAKPKAGPMDDLLDLPAPAKPKAGPMDDLLDLPAPAKPKAGPMDDLLDLPAPAKPKSGGFDDLLDLPAPAAPRGGGLDGLADLPAPVSSRSRDLDLDLPAPKAASGGLDLDLPAPKAAGGLDLDLPAPKAAAGGMDLDLPAPRAAGGMDLDLPAPKGATARRTPFDDWDSEAPGGLDELDLPAPKGGGLDLDLPAPKARGGGIADLPTPKSGGLDLDLPAPKARGGGIADLPAPRSGGLDLDLPMPKATGGGSVDLPAPKSGGLDLDLPMPKAAAAAAAAGLGALDLDLPTPSSPAPSGGDGLGLELPQPRQLGGGTADLDLGGGFDSDLPSLDADDDLALPEPKRRPSMPGDETADGRSGAGGMGFGELDLGGGDMGDELEFADLPQEEDVGALGPSAPAVARTSRDRVSKAELEAGKKARKPRKSRALLYLAVLLVLLVAGGVGLKFTNHGIFGMYFVEQFLPDAGDPAQVSQTIAAAEEQAASDTYSDARLALTALGAARRSAGLNRELLARSLTHESLHQVRFGDDVNSEGRSGAILARLEERGFDAPGIDLARAADSLRRGRTGEVRAFLASARSANPGDAYVDLVEGELELRDGNAVQAAAAFASAIEHGGGARGQWGVARAQLLGAEAEAEAAAAIEATLALSPEHVGARIAKARMLQGSDADAAIALLGEAVGRDLVGEARLRGSVAERSAGWTLLGRVQEEQGRRGAARQAYEAAVEVDSFHVSALAGLGRVLLAERRFGEALARFEAVIDAGEEDATAPGAERPIAVGAKIGAAQAMLALERPQDARAMLASVAETHGDDPEVVLWIGKAEEALDANDQAEASYRRVMELAPESFDGYLALAQLFFTLEQPDAAAGVLAEARRHVEETAEVRRMAGESELARGRLSAAISEFQGALELDAADTGAMFGLGIAQRRDSQLGRAEATFERLAAVDTAYPGLALERGRIFEARGLSERAVRSYSQALEQSPTDIDLMLRLGAAQVAANQLDEAEATLRRVSAERRDSAEATHFMGRVAFARGRLPVALEHFDRAVQLDPQRGEFHLYLGWAALESNNLGRAANELDAALERDDSLGDAYWLRARVLVRTGYAGDALVDARRALQLKPGRHEALVTMGDCFAELGNTGNAIRAYEQAVAASPLEGAWWQRLGELRSDAGRRGEAVSALNRAAEIGDGTDDPGAWLGEAHRLLGDLSSGAERMRHYRRYLEVAPASAIDRARITSIVRAAGG